MALKGFLRTLALSAGTALVVGATQASAAVLVFDLPAGQAFLGYSYSQNGYAFTNSSASLTSYENWIALGYPQYNAGPTANILQNWPKTTDTITNNSGAPFSFTSIGLASLFNNGSAGNVQFTFTHVGNTVDTATVSLASGVLGLQDFTFNESNLTSVAFTPETTQGPWLQFNDVGLSVPGPTPGAGLPSLAFLVLAGAMIKARGFLVR